MKIAKELWALDYGVELFAPLCLYSGVGQKPRGLRMQAEKGARLYWALFFMGEATVLDAKVRTILRL
jgi:hypothetical protein